MKKILFFILSISLTAFACAQDGETVSTKNAEELRLDGVYSNIKQDSRQYYPNEIDASLPCPFGWTVRHNPSVDNSISYLHADNTLAVSVTSLKDIKASYVKPELFARVAAEQLKCDLPVKSNLIEGAYSFTCKSDNVESIIYGEENNLAMLVVSGRNPSNEEALEQFIVFLRKEAER
jgi:hypothetical protein